MSGYLKHIQLTKQLEDKAKEAARNRQLAEEQVNMARALVTGAKRVDADVSAGEAMVAEADAAVAAKDYKLALEKATMAVMSLREAFRGRAQAIIDSSAGLLALAETLEQVPDAREALEAAKAALTKGDFDGAVEAAKRSWKRCEKVLHERLSSSFSTAQNLILVAKSTGRDTAGFEDLLSRARTALEKNDFEKAMAFTREGLDSLTADLEGDVTTKRNEVEELEKSLEASGADVSRVKLLLDRSREDFEAHQYDKALASLKQARNDGERALQRSLEGSAQALEKPLKEAESIGAEVGKAREALQRAQDFLRRGNMQGSLEAMAQFRKLLEEAKFQRVLNTIAQSRDKFVTARNLGLDTSSALDHLNKAREALKGNRFTEALQFAQEGDQELDGLVSVYSGVDKEAKSLEALAKEVEAEGADTTAALKLAERARQEAVARHSDAARDLMHKAQGELERIRAERAQEITEEASFLITIASRNGVRVVEEQRELAAVQARLRARDHATALASALRLRNSLEEGLTQYITRRMEVARAAPSGAKGDGQNIEALLTKAGTALGVKDFENALNLTDEALKVASAGLQEGAREVLEALQAGSGLLKALGQDPAAIQGPLEAVERAYREANFAQVPTLAAPALGMLQGQGDRLFEEVKALVVQLRNLNYDVEALKDPLRAAKNALQASNPIKSLVPLRQCQEETSRILAVYQEAHDGIAAIAVTAAEGKKRGIDMSKPVATLLEGKKLLEAGNFQGALDAARSAKAEAEAAQNTYQAQNALLTAREQVELAAHLGLSVDPLRKAMEDLKEVLKGGDMAEGLRMATEVRERALGQIRDHVSTEVSRAANLAAEMKAAGVDTRTWEGRIGQAREAQEKGDVRATAEFVRSVLGELEALRGRRMVAAQAAERLRQAMGEVDALGVDASAGEKPLRKAEKFLADERYDDVVRVADDGLRELDRARAEGIGQALAGFEQQVAKARGEGMNTRTADGLLRRARELLSQSQFKDALSLAMQSESELERIELQRDLAQKALATAKRKTSGVPLTADAKAMLIEAEKALNVGDFVKALDLSLGLGDEVNASQQAFRDIQGVIEAGQKALELAQRVGADVAKVQASLTETQAFIDRGAFNEARNASQRTRELALATAQARLGQMTSDVRGYLVLCSLMSTSPGNAEEKLSMARAHLDKGDLENAHAILQDAKKICETSLLTKLTEIVGNARAAIAYARKIGARTDEADGLLKQAQEALDTRQFDKAAMLAQKATETVEARRDLEKRFVDSTFQTDSLIKSAKKFGIDAREAERGLLRALELKKTDPAAALEAAEAALAKAREALDNFSPKVEATLEVSSPRPGAWQEAAVILRNDGKALAKAVTIQILGDAEAEGLQEIAVLRAQGMEKVPIRIKFPSPGRVPIILKVKATRVLDGKEYEVEKIQELEVGSPPAAGPQRIIADFDTRCLVCRGTIKKGFAAARCSCNSLYHEMCARRAGKCPVCSNSLVQIGG